MISVEMVRYGKLVLKFSILSVICEIKYGLCINFRTWLLPDWIGIWRNWYTLSRLKIDINWSRSMISKLGLIIPILKKNLNGKSVIDFIKSKITQKTYEVIQAAAERNITPYEYAVADSLNELRKKIKRKSNSLEKLNRRF